MAVLILGILVLLSGFLAPILSPEIAANLSGTGGIMIIAICLSMLKLVDYKLANSLPAIFIPIIYGIILKIIKKKDWVFCGDPIKLDQIPDRIYIFSGIFYAAFFSLYSIGLKYPNFSFILSLL